MHKAVAAEWILSLVTTRENAAATVGDLVETSTLSMASVFRIAAAGVLRQFTAPRPGRVTALAVAAFIGQFVAFSPAAIASLWLVRTYNLWDPAFMMPLFAIGFFVTQVFVGKWVVRLSPGCEMAVCLALGILNAIAGLSINNVSINMALWQIPIMLGVVWERRMTPRRATN